VLLLPLSLLASGFRDAGDIVEGVSDPTAGTPAGNWCHSRQRWLQGHPDDAQRWRGKRASANAVGTVSAAKGEVAQRPKKCRLCRPPKRSEVPLLLMPFSSFPRICSFSGRSGGVLLTYQRKVAPTTVFLPDHLWFLLVGGRVGVALVSAGRRHLSSYRVFRCMAPGRNSCCAAT
jgi:hypothetical protein